MSNPDDIWDLYWELRLHAIEDLGKREAILAVSKLAREQVFSGLLRLLELGCGEGQIIGSLVEAHVPAEAMGYSCGVDYSRLALEKARHAYPTLRFVEGDFTDPILLAGLGRFEIVLLVNALHEVFSSTYSSDLGEVDVPQAKRRVEQALAGAASCLEPGGWLALFDGLEPPGDLQAPVRIRFTGYDARRRFETFASEYHPFRIVYRPTGPLSVELAQRDFTRYIDKSIFLDKRLWQTERLESYQYFTEAEFRAAFARQGLAIRELRILTVNEDKWRAEVEIETPGASFPAEHILILAQK